MLGDDSNYTTEIRESLQKIRDEFGIDGVVLDEQIVLNGETLDQCGLLKVHVAKLFFTFYNDILKFWVRSISNESVYFT